MLLQGIDVLVRSRSVETLFLHVDVTNEAAIALCERAGYRKVTDRKKKNKKKVHVDYGSKSTGAAELPLLPLFD